MTSNIRTISQRRATRHDSSPAARWHRAAFTLVEASISIVLVSVLITGAMQVFGAAARAQRLQKDQARAMTLARALLAEIMQNAYEDANDQGILGTETGDVTGSRANFNDVDDYAGWTETPPKLKDGTTIAGLTGWTRAVVVKWVSPAATNFNTAAAASTDTGMKRVCVTVTAPSGVTMSLYGLRSAHSGYEFLPANTTSYTSCVGVSVQIGSDSSAAASASVNPENQVP